MINPELFFDIPSEWGVMPDMYTCVFKTDRHGPPVGMPCLVSASEYERAVAMETERENTVYSGSSYILNSVCLFPFDSYDRISSRWGVRFDEIALVEKDSFLSRVIMVEKKNFSAKEILTLDIQNNNKKYGCVMVEAPAEHCKGFFKELKSVVDNNFEYSSVLRYNTGVGYVESASDLSLVVVVYDIIYALPTFGRKTKDGLALIAATIDNRHLGTGMFCSLALIMSNELRCPFVVDGVKTVRLRDYSNDHANTLGGALVACKVAPVKKQSEFSLDYMPNNACTVSVGPSTGSPKKKLQVRAPKNKGDYKKKILHTEGQVYIKVAMRQVKDIDKLWYYD